MFSWVEGTFSLLRVETEKRCIKSQVEYDSRKVWRKGPADTQGQLLEELTVRLASKKRFGSHVFCEIQIVDMSFEMYEQTVRSSHRQSYTIH